VCLVPAIASFVAVRPRPIGREKTRARRVQGTAGSRPVSGTARLSCATAGSRCAKNSRGWPNQTTRRRRATWNP